MRILLTGGTGFIGGHLARRLIKEGHNIAVIVRPQSNLDSIRDISSIIKIYYYDGNYLSLKNAFELFSPTLVIHTASLFLSQHKSEDIRCLIDSNVIFPTQLLQAMCEFGVREIINTGTSWEHFNDEEYDPVNLYAASKQSFEALLTYYEKAKGIKSITLKLFDTYGPGDSRKKLFYLLRRCALSGEVLSMSPGEQLLDLVYIDDVINAYIEAILEIQHSEGHEIFAVSNRERISLKELTQIYSQIVKRPLSIDWGGLPYRDREVMIPWKNYKMLKNWNAKVDLNNGILNMESDKKIDGLLSNG